MRKFLTIVIISYLFSILSTQPAFAFELFGYRIWGSEPVQEPVDDEIAYTVLFHIPDAPKQLVNELRAASSLLSDAPTPATNTATLLARSTGDYRAFIATLYAAGYYAGDISIQINGVEVSDIPFTRKLPRHSSIAVSISTGPLFQFGNISIAPFPTSVTDRDSPTQITGLVTGAPALAGLIGDTTNLSIEAWRQEGHALAKIESRAVTADHMSENLNVDITIKPGPAVRYGSVSVSGNDAVDSDFLRFMANLPEGKMFDPDDLSAARLRLMRLGALQSVHIDEAGSALSDDSLPLGLEVRELAPRRIGIGATVASGEGLGVSAYWIHRNLFNKAERLRFDATVGGISGNSGLGTLDYSLGAKFTKPGIWTPDTNLTTSVTVAQTRIGDIEADNFDLLIGLTHMLPNVELGASAFVSLSETRDSQGTRNFQFAGVKTEAIWDSRNSTLNATDGFYLSASLSPLLEFTYDNRGLHSEVEARGYRSISDDDRYVLAGRTYVSNLVGLPIAEAPNSLLFFSGGGTSVRGYDYQSRGVLVDGNFSGGLSKVTLNAELRAKVTETIGVTAFFDVGTVGSEPWPTGADSWHRGAGIGLRYQTGFGPLRLDIARGLDRVGGDPEVGIYIGLGQAF